MLFGIESWMIATNRMYLADSHIESIAITIKLQCKAYLVKKV